MVFTSKWWYFLVITLPEIISALKGVSLQIEPRILQPGGDVMFTCSYDLDNSSLYSVKWYRGYHEFYRYIPSDQPSTRVFPLANISVAAHDFNGHVIVVRNVDFSLSGDFSCEVTTEAPNFYTSTAHAELHVVVLPESVPRLITENNTYEVGDTLRAYCRSGPSRPATTLTFSLNNMMVCKQCETNKYPSGDLFYSDMELVLPLYARHFNNGQLRLRCTAQIVDLYQANRDVYVFSEQEPIPERVMSASTASANVPTHTFVGVAVLLFWGCTSIVVH